MSAYAYQGSPSYDSSPNGSAHPATKQPFRQEPTSLPPIYSRTSQAPAFPPTLLKSEQDPHGHFSTVATSADQSAGITGFAPPQGNYTSGHSLHNVGSTHPHLLSGISDLPQQPYNNYTPQPMSAPQTQPALPSVTSMYGQPLGSSSMSSYGTSDILSRTQPHQQDGIKALASRPSRDVLGLDGQHESSVSAAANLNGVKNADGKWACTLCQKTYQHQKHLKRHNLRHTGERPYRCHLCHETFCRSDILKRHFQKCSVRRGNPQGVTHLTHAQDHLKKPKADSGQHPLASNALATPSTTGIDTNLQSRPTWFNQNSMYNNFGSGLPSSTTSVGTTTMGDSNGSSRSSSVPRPGSSGSAGEDRRAHFGTSHTLPPMHAPDASPVDSSRFNYESSYMRTGFNPQGPHQGEQSNTFFGHPANGGSSQFAMQQGHPFSHTTQNSHYQSIAPMNGVSNDQWMQDPHTAFHPNGHDALMYQGSS